MSQQAANDPAALGSTPSNGGNDPSTVGILDEFQTELVDYWRRLPNKTFFFGLLAAWLGLFLFLGNSVFGYVQTPSLFTWMVTAYNGNKDVSDDAVGNFVPLLVLGLFWWKRKELIGLPLNVWSPAFLLIAFAVALHVFGYVAQQPRISIVALFLGIYGLMGLAWGFPIMRHSFFPFFIFIFCVPLGNQAEFITFRLRLLVCWLVEIVSHSVLGIGVMRVGTQLYDPSGSFQYEVAAACSGIRSLIVIFLLATTYGFVTFRSPWKRLFLIALSAPFAVLGNLIRMLFIIVAASVGGQSWGNWAHENGVVSIIPYVVTIFGLLYFGGRLEKIGRVEKVRP